MKTHEKILGQIEHEVKKNIKDYIIKSKCAGEFYIEALPEEIKAKRESRLESILSKNNKTDDDPSLKNACRQYFNDHIIIERTYQKESGKLTELFMPYSIMAIGAATSGFVLHPNHEISFAGGLLGAITAFVGAAFRASTIQDHKKEKKVATRFAKSQFYARVK
ncbi:hypothetical protein COV93_01575 [Candidatus Woesearchaeota archaeon CG11_big_fil_rev_8_21_14_0_20_43_8]|nr:MAG: hypothetical protein COV93_01575 [Candidatus Woesearchaeota archaeon CG11_big_fil_rev_8_21_14_0_20_43_8]